MSVERQYDELNRDHFELISAYLDGEVTAQERQQVERLLAEDPQARQLHRHLQDLQVGIRALPVAETSRVSAHEQTQRILERIDRRQHRNMKLVWGGIAAALVGAVSSSLMPGQLQLASGPSVEPTRLAASPKILVTLERPLLQIPQSAVQGQAAVSGGADAALSYLMEKSSPGDPNDILFQKP